jgi:hypothetical protein
MISGAIWRGDDEEEDENVFAIEAGKINTGTGDADCGGELFNGRVFGMGNCDTVTDSGGTQFFPFEDCGHDGFFIGGTEGSGLPQAGRHFTDNVFFSGGLESGEDGFLDDELSEFHKQGLNSAEGNRRMSVTGGKANEKDQCPCERSGVG